MRSEEITKKVSERYAKAAASGEQMCCPSSYNFPQLKSFIPQAVLNVSYGCGTPAGLNTVKPGETVLDIGSGGGIDCFEASRLVGHSGHVIGLDVTDTMLEIARHHAPIVAKNLGYASSNVEFRKGTADAMPVENNTIDLVISNCVINLAPDKTKVFREMFRVIRPDGRFTISDIVTDRVVPQYLVHDVEKWGDCLSGALTFADYLRGLRESGFVGVHLVQYSPWKVIDGIHFFSVTLTGYKLSTTSRTTSVRFATLRGPFSSVVDEYETVYRRGIPEPIETETVHLLSQPSLANYFLLSPEPVRLDQDDSRWSAVLPAEAPCVWQGHFAMLGGPFMELADDDHHLFRMGEPVEICSKTVPVLETIGYAPHFAIINRASEPVHGRAVSCTPNGACC
jgi:SAM-dependent methyltransferase